MLKAEELDELSKRAWPEGLTISRRLAEDLIDMAREAIRLKGLQHENSVLMQSRRTLIQLNDRYREALKYFADNKNWQITEGPETTSRIGKPLQTCHRLIGVWDGRIVADKALRGESHELWDRAALTPEASP